MYFFLFCVPCFVAFLLIMMNLNKVRKVRLNVFILIEDL
jgi:hypothetical protein